MNKENREPLKSRKTLFAALPLLLLSLLLAPTVAQGSVPGTCLQFNGTNGYVSIAHNAALNAYPLTITAWIKTLHNANLYDGIVSKYVPGSFNGFSLFVLNGHLRAWYFRDGSNYTFDGGNGIDGGSVADGNWHHIALVVNPTNGTLYVDGNVGGFLNWTGTPGPPSSTAALLLGQGFLSPSFTNTFAGQIDEVTFWNRALMPSELNYLKHRSMQGREDGLLGYWRFDEGLGNVANNSVGGGASFNGLLTNGFSGQVVLPAWAASQAAIALDPIATNCLKFDGVNGYAQVAHNTTLNAYPLTAAAWFRTTNLNGVCGIASKYADASGNGWTLILQNGKLRGFYFRTLSAFAMDATSAAFVNDGAWHHAAMTVDASGGKLWLDGAVVGIGTWNNTAGAPTSTEPLQIGRYYNFPQRFLGVIDEVSVWNRALATNEIQAIKNLPLVGNEANLVAYWRLDEGSGTTVNDATGNGNTGTLISSPAWTGSTAYLGDGSVHLLGDPGTPNLTRSFMITTATNGSQNCFAETDRSFFRRFYDFGTAPASVLVGYHIDPGVQVAGSGSPLSVNPSTASGSFTMSAYNASSPQPIFFGSVASVSTALAVQPATGVQLDSVNNLHQTLVTLSHSENGGGFVTDGTAASDPARLLHFDGNLFFGSIQTTFLSIANTPAAGTINAAGIATILAVNNNSGTLTANPNYHYGSGALLNVTLQSNGDAVAASGTTVSLTGSDRGCVSNICYTRSGLTLSNSTISGVITLILPPGISVCTNFGTYSRMTTAQVPFPLTFLDPASLDPLPSALTRSGPLYVIDETKPFWMRTPSLTWHPTAGEIDLAGPLSAMFVRQEDDDVLMASGASLVESNLVNRISNDGYYRNASNILSSQVTVTADTNGLGLINVQLALNPPELRPHFPYTSNAPGAQIVTTTGQLTISNSVIDTANSSLSVVGPVPLQYARDCFDTNCGAASIAPAILAFTPLTGALGFTTDGGLLAYGSVPPAGLTWGYGPSGTFAQQTSPVSSGAYHMPGTFLRADQAPAALNPAAILLLSGFGDDANPYYLERPMQAAYADGFANYAGLNFRAPVQGRSYIAGQDTDWYDLTARSKYYVRFGGVSGIHEAESFNKLLALYGYPFTFTSYRLSYLDSENWESRTDGSLALPYPANFPQEFARMKFICKGDLDSAQVPASSGVKRMDYWHTDIKPLSIEFYPTNNDVCGTSPRFLVLGVQTKLPFLGEAFHTTLGFKNNGNLVNSQDNVKGCDSRFQVPSGVTLAGPGTSGFPVTPASDAYFNNWETVGKPTNGFFNIVGSLRAPFFPDIKVHLHVTPSGPSSGTMDVMGGWPAKDSNDQDFGWTVGGKNYFNTAKFDRHADGWPQGISISNYRQSGNDSYHPRAQREWIDVAHFNYPLSWNPVLHQFVGWKDAKVILPVIDVNSRLKQLSPGKIDFDFAQDITLQIPALKVLDFANDALNEINAPINSVSGAIKDVMGSTFNTIGLTSGFRSIQNVLRQDATSFFTPILKPALANAAHQIYLALADIQRTNSAALMTSIGPILNSSGIQTGIGSINGTYSQPNSVFGTVHQALADVDTTLDLFIQVLEKRDGSNNRQIVSSIIKKLVADQGPALGIFANLTDNLVNPLLQELEPTLAQIDSELHDIKTQFDALRAQMEGASGDFSGALQMAVNDTTSFNAYLQQANNAISSLLGAMVTPASNYFTDDPAAAEQAILNRLMIGFMSSPMPGKYQETFRQFMTDDDFLMNQLMNVLFDQINRSIREGLESQIAGANDGVFQAMKGIGQMSQSFLSAKIRGAPSFTGDNLDSIHLDAAVQLNLPDEMHFNAYMDIKQLNSATTPLGCIPPGAAAAEVTLGAKDVPLGWAGITSAKPLTLTVEGRWTLQSGKVLGIGGLFDIKGEAGFKGCSVNEIGADFAIGELENYFAAKAAGTITVLIVPVDVQVGIFAGHACSLDPLRFIDPNADKVIPNAVEFSGLYLQYGGGLDLSEILGLGHDCWLDVRAGISTAVYYQGGPRSGKIGFRQQDSVDLDLACVISGHVDFALGASVTYTPPTDYEIDVSGEANLCGSLGYCPICVSGCKGILVTGAVTDGKIHYHIDGP